MKSKNLNYNSQIFTLTSLFLHSTSSSINATTILFLKDPNCCWLAAVAAPPQILDHSHTQ